MSEEKRQRIRDLARESTLIDAIDLAQQICETAINERDSTDNTGTGPGTTDDGGTGPGTTDDGGTGPETTDGGGTGPGTTDDGGVEPPLPCTEFVAGCEYYYEGPKDGRTTTFDGQCHDCVQSVAIPPEMNYSVVGSGFRTGTVYKVVNVHGNVLNAPLLSDNKTIEPNVYDRLESVDFGNNFITIEPLEGYNQSEKRAPFLGTEYPYNRENTCVYVFGGGCDAPFASYGESTTVTDFEIFVQGFDFSKPNYGLDNPLNLKVTLDICPGPSTDDPYAPDPNSGCKPVVGGDYPICADYPTIQFQAYIFFPGRNRYESYNDNSSANVDSDDNLDLFNKNGWVPMYDEDSWTEDFGRGFGPKSYQPWFSYLPPDDYPPGEGGYERIVREMINPYTGTIIVRVVSTQPTPSPINTTCPLFNVHLNEIRACVSGDCALGVLGGMSNGQPPLDRPVYDCSDTPLVLNNANDTHVKLNSLVMNAPLIGNNWFENFLVSENKNKPFISGSYLNSDYIESYPCFESLESSRFSGFLYPTINDNNDNWILQDLFQPPINQGYISVQEEGIGNITRIVSFTIHSSSGQDTPDDNFLVTQYTLNPRNIPEDGTLSFDLEFTPSSDPYSNLFFNPIGYSITNSFGTRTVIYPNFAHTRYSTSVSINISPGDTLRLFVRRYIALTGSTRQYESSSLTVKNLIFESETKRYGQVVSYIANLDYCNTNEGYDPNWPGTDRGTDFPVENGINGLKIIETMRAETNDKDLIIKRGMWLYNHTEEVWVGNPCGNVNEDIDLSPGIDLNTLHPYWKMRSKCKEWSEDDDPPCKYDPNINYYDPISCGGNPVINKQIGNYVYGQVECEAEQFPIDNLFFPEYKQGCKDFDCCCQICNSPVFSNLYTKSCCGTSQTIYDLWGWDLNCSSLARRFCGNDVYCEDTSFFPPSGYGLHDLKDAQTIPSGCCGSPFDPEPAFQFGTVDWTTHLNFESYDAKDFIDSNGKVTVCFVFTSYKNKNSYNVYELDEQGPKSSNSPYTIYIDRLRAVPVSSTEYIPPPDSSDGYSDPLIVLPPWLTDLIPDGSGTGTTDNGGGGGIGGGGISPGS